MNKLTHFSESRRFDFYISFQLNILLPRVGLKFIWLKKTSIQITETFFFFQLKHKTIGLLVSLN